MARPRIHDEDTRDQILQAAGRVLRTEGASAVTVRRLADEVDASTSAIYSLFGSKHGVVGAMYRAGFENLAAHEDAVTARDPVERIRLLAAAYRTAATSRPHLYDVMFACPFPDFEPGDEDRALSLGTLDVLGDAVGEAIVDGRLHGDPSAITLGLWSVVHGLATLELQGALQAQSSADEVWATTVDAVLAGLSVDPLEARADQSG